VVHNAIYHGHSHLVVPKDRAHLENSRWGVKTTD
jgi:hypothetical protein